MSLDNSLYSPIYRKRIRGDAYCPFWRSSNGGTCDGSPGINPGHKCPADVDGCGCPWFRARRKLGSDTDHHTLKARHLPSGLPARYEGRESPDVLKRWAVFIFADIGFTEFEIDGVPFDPEEVYIF